MAHVAELQNGIVTRVVVASNDVADPEAWCVDFFKGGVWKQTSYNARMRGCFAGIGYSYDEALDRFIPPQPYPSWTFDGQEWTAPVPMPEGPHVWDEAQGAWVAVELLK